MTLFNIIAWNNREEIILAQHWQEAVDIFINNQNDDDFNLFDIEHVIYADIFKTDGVYHFIDGSIVAADGSYPYAAPWNEVLDYLASK